MSSRSSADAVAAIRSKQTEYGDYRRHNRSTMAMAMNTRGGAPGSGKAQSTVSGARKGVSCEDGSWNTAIPSISARSSGDASGF